MSAERHSFLVRSTTPPIVEVDSQAPAVYVRFKRASVAKTVPLPCEAMHVAVDLDHKGEVIGIEVVGMTEFSVHTIQLILKRVSVEVPNMDFSRARYVPAGLVAA
jgi:uncharacterized protein YuzE